MELSHRFTVPTPVEETWAHFQDIASVAECFPGAQVTSAEGDSFAGSVKVKLGPIALVYNGSGTFVEKDDAAHRFVVDAKGKDKRGNGTAGAKVTLAMATADGGGTDVSVDTDLAITGKPAQFGRGVMQDVSDKLLGQFVACLEQRLASGDGAEGADSSDGAGAAPAEAEPTAAADPVSPGSPVSPVSSAPSLSSVSPASPVSSVDPEDAAESAAHSDQAAPAARPVSAVPPAGKHAAAAPAPAAQRSQPASGDDALDLGATVLPILLKTYRNQALAALAAVLLVVLWRRRAGRGH